MTLYHVLISTDEHLSVLGTEASQSLLLDPFFLTKRIYFSLTFGKA